MGSGGSTVEERAAKARNVRCRAATAALWPLLWAHAAADAAEVVGRWTGTGRVHRIVGDDGPAIRSREHPRPLPTPGSRAGSDPYTYVFRGADGEEVRATRGAFARAHGIKERSMADLLGGRVQVVKGWSCLGWLSDKA